MFDIQRSSEGHVALIGRFDASQVDRAQDVFDTLTESCIIDCQALDYISSAGLGVLLGTYKRLEATGGTLKLIRLKKLVRDVFRYSRIDTIIEVE